MKLVFGCFGFAAFRDLGSLLAGSDGLAEEIVGE
jgi:hypothetical protein